MKNISKAEETRQYLASLLPVAQQRAGAARKAIFKPQWEWAVDWGDFRKGKLVGYNGIEWRTFNKPLEEVVKELAAEGASSIVIEGSFGSFDLREVARVLRAAAECNVAVGKIPTAQTERYRRTVLGFEDGQKSEQIDALCIREIANHQSCFVAPLKAPSEEQIARQVARRNSPTGKAIQLRSLAWPSNDCDEFMRYLPDDVDDERILSSSFSDGKRLKPGWCIPLIAASLEVLSSGGDRKAFDRRVGYSAFGYPNYLRSNHYYGMVAPAVKRALGAKNKEELNTVDKDKISEARKAESSRHRWVARWIFANVKKRYAA
jgi:hypothetical protein